MRETTQKATQCRVEVIPEEGKEVAILTFSCMEGCQTDWPVPGAAICSLYSLLVERLIYSNINVVYVVDVGLSTKEFFCGRSSLAWQDADSSLEGIWPTCSKMMGRV